MIVQSQALRQAARRSRRGPVPLPIRDLACLRDRPSGAGVELVPTTSGTCAPGWSAAGGQSTGSAAPATLPRSLPSCPPMAYSPDFLTPLPRTPFPDVRAELAAVAATDPATARDQVDRALAGSAVDRATRRTLGGRDVAPLLAGIMAHGLACPARAFVARSSRSPRSRRGLSRSNGRRRGPGPALRRALSPGCARRPVPSGGTVPGRVAGALPRGRARPHPDGVPLPAGGGDRRRPAGPDLSSARRLTSRARRPRAAPRLLPRSSDRPALSSWRASPSPRRRHHWLGASAARRETSPITWLCSAPAISSASSRVGRHVLY